MPDTLVPILDHVPAFLLVLVRLSGIFIFAPLFSSPLVPMRVKALLSAVLAVCVYPLVPPQIPLELSIWSIGPIVAIELLVGVAIGLAASLPLLAMQVAGELMGQQLGFALARVFNPEFNEETETLGQVLFLVAITIFLLLDGHLAMLAVLVASFQSIPLGGLVAGESIVQMLVGLLTASFELALRVAAPLLCLVFLETIAIGFVARTVPQFNILSLGFPLRILAGLTLTLATVTLIGGPLAEAIRHAISSVMRVLS